MFRYSKNSTFVVECPNDSAWLGGFVENGDYPVNWDTGYGGLLCSECQIYNDTKYEKLTDFQWSKCPDPILNALKVIALGVLVLPYSTLFCPSKTTNILPNTWGDLTTMIFIF